MGKYNGEIPTIGLSVLHVQGADIPELERNLAFALTQISGSYRVTAIRAAGGGKGHVFTVAIEYGIGQGYLAANLHLICYLADSKAEVGVQYAAAVARIPALHTQVDCVSVGGADGGVTGGVLVAIPDTQKEPDNQWAYITNYYINGTTGSDLNNGTASTTPLATWAEIVRRLGPTPEISVVMRVHIMSDLDEVLGLGIDPVFQDLTSGIVFTGYDNGVNGPGVKTVNVTGSIVNVHTPAAPGTEGTLTDTVIADYTPYIGRRIRFTNGPLANYCTFISNIGAGTVANTAQIGLPTYRPAASWSRAAIDVNAGAAAGGNTYNIETLFSVRGVSLRCSQFALGGSTYTDYLGLVVENLAINGAYAASNEEIQVTGVLQPAFVNCAIYKSMIGDSVSLYGCGFVQNTTAGNVNTVAFDGMNVLLSGISGGGAVFYNCVVAMPTECQFGLTAPVSFERGSVSSGVLNFGLWHNLAAFGIYVDISSSIHIGEVIGVLTAASVNADAWVVNGSVWYDTKPAAPTPGAGGSDTVIGGAAVAYGGTLPSITAANNAMIVAAP